MASSTQHQRVAPETFLTLDALEQAMQAADPSVVLAPSRILRRVIKKAADIPGLGLRVPHRKTFVISRTRLAEIVEAHELRLPDQRLAQDTRNLDPAGPDSVILLPQPAPEFLADTPAAKVLSKYWRLLFHARVHRAFDEGMSEGRLTAADIQQRIARLGRVEFEEARGVLEQEDLLLPPKNDISTYIEFAAVYLELRFFVGSFLPAYFADLRNLERVDALLREDIDAKGLFQVTRPAGAPEQPWRGDLAVEETAPERHRPLAPSGAPSPWRFRYLLRWSDRASRAGNLVRAAIARMQAARFAQPDHARQSRAEARAYLNRLTHRLEQALGFTVAEAEDWSRSLTALLDVAAHGIWTPEARLLYDLQKVCGDHERVVYALDLMRWITTFGRAPLKRKLPGQQIVLMSKHLGAAKHRLHAVRVSSWVRSRLESLVEAAIERTERQLRARFRPKIVAALDQVQLTPRNLPETVARAKLVEELLDRVADRGFLAMGDLRDGLSRNNLKLPDLASGRQFLWGDQLLRADTLLAESLDGVYRHGEIYLRWPQRLSSLAFGLPIGRLLTRHVALPFGGAFLTIEFFQHVINIIRKHLLDLPELVPLDWFKCFEVGILGAFLWGLFYHAGFRGGCLKLLRDSGKLLHAAIIEWPSRLLELPQVRAIVHSRAFRLAVRFGLKPLLLSALLMAIVDGILRSWPKPWGMALLFVGVNLLVNSRLGRNVDELVTDLAIEGWRRFRIHVVAAIFRLIMEVFNRLLEGLERLLYAVDEWLRFRSGEGRWSTAIKSVLGVAWAFVHYIIRFCVTLLVEPQLNPIKHFPVVTVSHKVLSPLIFKPIESWLETAMSTVWASFIAASATLLLPGVFGFLVWELKENWRLYAANRPPNLEPVPVGHHGETVLQLLKPGFRSGTIPKFYAKLRRANRKAFWSGRWRSVRKQRDALHHIEESVRRLVDRELLAVLQNSRGWDGRGIQSGEIHLGANRVTIELRGAGCPRPGLLLAFEERSGLLVVGIADRDWLDQLPSAARGALDEALAGFYKIAGVHLVRQQFEPRLPADAESCEYFEEGLLVRMQSGCGPARFYSVTPISTVAECPVDDDAQIMSADECRMLIFAWNPISWQRWVTIWQGDHAEVSVPPATDGDLSMLPPPANRDS